MGGLPTTGDSGSGFISPNLIYDPQPVRDWLQMVEFWQYLGRRLFLIDDPINNICFMRSQHKTQAVFDKITNRQVKLAMHCSGHNQKWI